MDLKEVLFHRTQEELKSYFAMAESGENTDEEREKQRERFSAVYQVIDEAKLEDEYQDWKKKNIPELQD